MQTNEKIIENPYGFIYITTNTINGMRYLGQKTFDKDGDWKYYLGSGIRFKNALNFYGRENFYRNIVCFCYSQEELNKAEYELSILLNVVESSDWYNLVYGGGGACGHKHSEATKEKISKNRKGICSGEAHPMYNKTHTEESKAKMSASHKKENLSKDTIRKMSQSSLSKWENNEYRDRMISVHKKENLSNETIEKMCIAAKLRWTDEKRMLQSQKRKGTIVPDEVRQKISEHSTVKREIVQLNLDGDLVSYYESIAEAYRVTNINEAHISSCCRNKRKTADGFRWMYKEDYEKQLKEQTTQND